MRLKIESVFNPDSALEWNELKASLNVCTAKVSHWEKNLANAQYYYNQVSDIGQ